jgi:hypothetical protein
MYQGLIDACMWKLWLKRVSDVDSCEPFQLAVTHLYAHSCYIFYIDFWRVALYPYSYPKL